MTHPAGPTLSTEALSHSIAPAIPVTERRAASLTVAVASLAVHLRAGWALGWIPAPTCAAPMDNFVELHMPTAPAPVVAPEPEPEVIPDPVVPVVQERRVQEVARIEAEPEPIPEPAALPPSLEEAFGEEPAAAAPTLVATTGGTEGFAVDPGQAGGVPGGHGTGTAASGTSQPAHEAVAAGPSEADRRRARRAYVRSLEGLLGGRVHYPRSALRDRVEGRVEVCLRIGESGQILGRRICGSAGAHALDEAALQAATELSRVPAPPSLAAWSATDEIHAGVAFVIQ